MKSDHFADLELQLACTNQHIPSMLEFQSWVDAAYVACGTQLTTQPALTLRIVDPSEIQELNRSYRFKDKPTNVLSFPAELPEEIKQNMNILGDIIICAELVEKEALEQDKAVKAHWAHMVIHGCLHLLGYDHEKHDEAEIMESLEVKVLESLGFPNPY